MTTPSGLTGSQKKYLRGIAMQLKPGLVVGRDGLTGPFLAEVEKFLLRDEILKLRFVTSDRTTRQALIEDLTQRANCHHVGSVGHTATFFRENPSLENPLLEGSRAP